MECIQGILNKEIFDDMQYHEIQCEKETGDSDDDICSNLDLDHIFILFFYHVILYTHWYGETAACGPRSSEKVRQRPRQRQFLSIRRLLNSNHNDLEMRRWIPTFKYHKEAGVGEEAEEAALECVICLSPFDEREEISINGPQVKQRDPNRGERPWGEAGETEAHAGDGGNEDEPNQDLIIRSSQAVMIPDLLSGDSQPNLTKDTLSIVMGGFVQEYLDLSMTPPVDISIQRGHHCGIWRHLKIWDPLQLRFSVNKAIIGDSTCEIYFQHIDWSYYRDIAFCLLVQVGCESGCMLSSLKVCSVHILATSRRPLLVMGGWEVLVFQIRPADQRFDSRGLQIKYFPPESKIPQHGGLQIERSAQRRRSSN
ncbi:hypothetical protein IEQ34_008037 [Dendrobium chrysotoxum]|uniref:Uncharacterized protein n=1 Tax=Dendrobium chrysotoxum TaxID=161865 RepID=A0AAV7GNM0_DENCH|nr:hypothetical protein IEQ34_008037 [Dendrobium chrysotoxum]